MDSARGQQRGRPASRDGRLVVVGGYTMLLLLGAVQSLTGCFEYSRALGSVPVAALAFDVAILVTCVLGAWGMRSPLGGLMPAVGWFVSSFVLAMSTPGGSVVIAANIGASKWFLFGGSACAAAGVLVAFAWSSAARKPSP